MPGMMFAEEAEELLEPPETFSTFKISSPKDLSTANAPDTFPLPSLDPASLTLVAHTSVLTPFTLLSLPNCAYMCCMDSHNSVALAPGKTSSVNKTYRQSNCSHGNKNKRTDVRS